MCSGNILQSSGWYPLAILIISKQLVFSHKFQQQRHHLLGMMVYGVSVLFPNMCALVNSSLHDSNTPYMVVYSKDIQKLLIIQSDSSFRQNCNVYFETDPMGSC